MVAKFIVYAFGIDVTYSGPGGGYMDGLIGGFWGGCGSGGLDGSPFCMQRCMYE